MKSDIHRSNRNAIVDLYRNRRYTPMNADLNMILPSALFFRFFASF